jgi:hypothetical protein
VASLSVALSLSLSGRFTGCEPHVTRISNTGEANMCGQILIFFTRPGQRPLALTRLPLGFIILAATWYHLGHHVRYQDEKKIHVSGTKEPCQEQNLPSNPSPGTKMRTTPGSQWITACVKHDLNQSWLQQNCRPGQSTDQRFLQHQQNLVL